MMQNISFVLEIFATISGLLQGVLVMLNKRSNWIFYILQVVFLFFFSAINRLYGDMTNNVIFLFMGIYGIIMWNKNNNNLPVTKLNRNDRYGYLLLLFFATVITGFVLSCTADPLPWIDAFTTVSAFFATWFMANKKLDAWILWTVNDLIYVIEYALLPNPAYYLLGLNIVWTVMAIISYLNWKHLINQRSKDETNITVADIDRMCC